MERVPFSTNGLGQLDIYMQRQNVDTDLTPFTKSQLKMDHRPVWKMQDCETSGRSMGENVGDLGFGSEFSDTVPKA